MERGRAGDERLVEAGLILSSALSLPVILQRIVELAAEITGARYGALGVLGPDGTITEFVTTGVSEAERAAIGHIPLGRGILGVLIADARPLRLAELGGDPRSVGFPPNHPPMHSFLGVPVTARGRVFGNLYLTQKQDAAAFDDDDERALVVLAAQAGVAIANARLYEQASDRARRLEALGAVAAAILAGDRAEAVLGLVARAARELAGADLATVAVPADDGGELVVQAADGAGAARLRGLRFPAQGSVAGEVLRSGTVVVLAERPPVGLGGVGPALLLPLSAKGRTFGALTVARDRGGGAFREADVQLLEAFAAQAAVALEHLRLRRELDRLLVIQDRERIAKELHDGAIQALFAVGLGLQAAATLARDPELAARIEGAVAELDRVIGDLRNYIFGLRPGILADRQLEGALRRLVEEFAGRSGVVAVAEIDPQAAAALAANAGDVVQLAREALSNVSRHAAATTCRLSLRQQQAGVVLEVDDDGRGFDPDHVAAGEGHGLDNLRQRAAALGGHAQITSTPGHGTTVRATIPH
jgi:signal transduction histidine kinase